MTPEQWETIGTIIGIPVSVIAIISAVFAGIRWVMNKHKGHSQNKLSKKESECIQAFESQDAALEWSEGMDRSILKNCEALIKKQYLEEWSSSPSRAMVLFGLSDKGKEAYKKLCFSNNAKIVKAIRSLKKIFVDKIASTCGSSESDVYKVIGIMEEEGMLTPIKSDNRGTLFWTHKN